MTSSPWRMPITVHGISPRSNFGHRSSSAYPHSYVLSSYLSSYLTLSPNANRLPLHIQEHLTGFPSVAPALSSQWAFPTRLIVTTQVRATINPFGRPPVLRE